MGRAPLPKKKTTAKRRTAGSRTTQPRQTQKKKSTAQSQKKNLKLLLRDGVLVLLESIGLIALGLAGIIVLLGYSGNRFSGTDVVSSLLPFAGGILVTIIIATGLLSIWRWIRTCLKPFSPMLPAAIILGLAIFLGCLVPRGYFVQAFGYYRTLVGGKEEAARVTLAHQVYAAYRRLGSDQVEKMIVRAESYTEAIEDAAKEFDLDSNVLKGLAATESSYLPRKSIDGGHGLFQITQAPKRVQSQVNAMFASEDRDVNSTRYNAYLGAATLKYYLQQMGDDLFLGLLAYNIGPANGGLRFIMEQYGATDFITIQPYLLKLPRDYPIRVLSYGLAFHIYQKEGQVLAYEEDGNAMKIQAIGIPGL